MIKVLSLFSGMGAFEKSLKNISLPHTIIAFSEIEKAAITAYSAIHDVSSNLNLGDISKINPLKLPDFDLLTHGSPCTDYSIAGNNFGGDKGSGTRSSLMWYTVEIIASKKPKYVIWENVSNVLSVKHRHNFQYYIDDLKKYGYNSYYQVLNAKDYGIPQNRKRIFVVSIRNDVDNQTFTFPKPKQLNKYLSDYLEKNVHEKYYKNDAKSEQLLESIKTILKKSNDNAIVHSCMLTERRTDEAKKIRKEYLARGKDYCPRRAKEVIPRQDNICNCITSTQGIEQMLFVDQKIRRLTPLECFRLMGFSDQDYQKCIENNISDSALYKMAGNSIVVNLLEEIFKNIFKNSCNSNNI